MSVRTLVLVHFVVDLAANQASRTTLRGSAKIPHREPLCHSLIPADSKSLSVYRAGMDAIFIRPA
jgi:hypothetical protein